jgi:hypothetical protein
LLLFIIMTQCVCQEQKVSAQTGRVRQKARG